MSVPSSQQLGLTFVSKTVSLSVSIIFTYGGQRDSTDRTAKATSAKGILKNSAFSRLTVIVCNRPNVKGQTGQQMAGVEHGIM